MYLQVLILQWNDLFTGHLCLMSYLLLLLSLPRICGYAAGDKELTMSPLGSVRDGNFLGNPAGSHSHRLWFLVLNWGSPPSPSPSPLAASLAAPSIAVSFCGSWAVKVEPLFLLLLQLSSLSRLRGYIKIKIKTEPKTKIYKTTKGS